MSTNAATPPAPLPDDNTRLVNPNFITEIISEDLRNGRHHEIVTRFPPEPNGYAHIGHAVASLINFGLAEDYGGRCNLRFDDTNPEVERMEYARAIERDLRWLGLEWEDRLFFASDYFEKLFQMALRLVREGKAYVDSLSEDEIVAYRGTVTQPGENSPYRTRSIEENLDLFQRMRAGEFADGTHVLRAKIDMSSPNMKLRDPLLYRIRHAPHYRTGSEWPIYPMYDFQHPLSDALEGVTHSLCSLEFVENRAVYDWLVDNLFDPPRPRQYEFGRRSLEYTVVSKRKLITLVEGGHVSGWDDPRMPTLAGLRRRGVTPEAIRDFVGRIGISRTNRTVDIVLLEYAIRDDLNTKAPRVMAVLDPLKVVITNYPEGETESLEAPYWPHDIPKEGTREVSFSRELYIERSDFQENPPKGFYRLSPGKEVRLRYAYVIRCDEVVKDESGTVTELRCSYDPDTLGKNPEGRKVKGTVHWVSAPHALPAEVRLYDRLFRVPDPDAGEAPFTDHLNPNSLETVQGFVEPSIGDDPVDMHYQFERQGYFVQDALDSSPESLVFNRVVTLKDTWAKRERDATPEVTKPEPEGASKPPLPPTREEQPDLTRDFSPEQHERLRRYTSALEISPEDAQILAAEAELSSFFEEALNTHDNPQGVANWIVNELLRELKDKALTELPVTPAALAELVALIDDDTVSNRTAKEVFGEMVRTGDAPQSIVERQGLEQVSDEGALEPIVTHLIEANPDKVAAYQSGKTGLLGFFVGGVMRETDGKANPQLVQRLIRERLEG